MHCEVCTPYHARHELEAKPNLLPTTSERITAALQEHGPQSATQLAARLQANRSYVAALLTRSPKFARSHRTGPTVFYRLV